MSKIKKILCMLLVFAMIIAPCSLFNTALAQTADSEPLKIEVSTDKANYSAYGIAEITVKVTNISDETINNISAEAVFDDLAPVGKNNVTSKEIDSLKSGESFSFSYKATLNANKVKINFFEKIILWFVRLFNGGYNATENNFDNGRELIENHHTINFGSHAVDNNVRVWYDLVTFSLFDADKFTIDVGTETDVKFQIKINSTQSIKNNEVELFCENEVVGILNDNGKNSDNVAGDNIFSGIITVSENERMSKYYYVECNGVKSDTKELDFYKQATDDEEIIMKSFREATDEIKAKYRSDIVDAIDENSALKAAENLYYELADYLDNNPYIAEYQFVEFGIMVAFDFGLNSGISLNDMTYGENISSNSRGIAGAKTQLNATNNEELKIITLEPSADELSTTVIDDAARKIESSKSNYVFSDNLDNQTVTVETMKSLDKYRIIILNGHGGNWDGDGYVVPLSEKPNETKNNYYKSTRDLDKTILDYGAYYVITEAFFDKYYSKDDLKNCLIYLGTCHGGDDNVKIRDILDRKGAQAVITYKNSVTCTYSDEMAESIFEYLSDDYTITEAVEKAKQKNGAKDPYITQDTYDKLTIWQQMGWNLGLLKLENPAEIILSGNNLQFQLSTKIIEDCGTIVSGIVKDKETNEAISGVTVEVVDNESGSSDPISTVTTNENGVFSVELPYGDYSFSFNHDNYEYYSIAQTVDVDYVSFGEISLIPKNSSSGGNDSTGGEDEERTVTDSGSCGDNLTWTLYDDGELVISGTGDMTDWSTSVSAVPWYSSRSLIKNVSIHSGITSIGDNSFYSCVALTNITIPKGVTSIGESAFKNCSALKNITLPDSVISISGYTFASCTSLTNITIPSGVTTIGWRAFVDCTSLENISISDSVTNINRLAFENCPKLKYITVDSNNSTYSSDEYGVLFNKDKTILIQYPAGNNRTSYNIPKSVTSIGDYAFENSDYLANVEIPTSVTSVGADAFNNCNSLNNITIPDSVTSIGADAFASCSALEKISLHNSLKNIGARAFYGCISLKEITIPGSVKSISESTFENCTALENISILEGVTSIGSYAFDDCDSLINITIPASITSTDRYAFYSCNSLKNVTISNGITSIGANSFNGCNSLENITLPNSVTIIGDGAFSSCSSLENITIPDSVTSIGGSAFELCSALKNIILPASITNINEWTFYGCGALESITIPENVTSIGFRAFWRCAALKNITIPNKVTSIGDYAFSDCTALTSITIPDSITNIGNYVFKGCSALANISISEYVTSIGNSAFSDCISLTNIEIPDSVTTIGAYAFYGCSSLTNISIPYNVTKISGYTFAGCRALTNIVIPENITNIGTRAFSACSSLKNITLPNSVTVIEDNAFSGCSSLESIIIPDNVTSIGEESFSYCTSLENITISRSVTDIGFGAFLDCSYLTNVYYKGSEVEWNQISIDFYNTSLTNATIHYNS